MGFVLESRIMWEFCDHCGEQMSVTGLTVCDYCGDYYCDMCTCEFDTVLCCTKHCNLVDFCSRKCWDHYSVCFSCEESDY